MGNWPFRKLAPEVCVFLMRSELPIDSLQLRNKIWELVLIHNDPILVRDNVKVLRICDEARPSYGSAPSLQGIEERMFRDVLCVKHVRTRELQRRLQSRRGSSQIHTQTGQQCTVGQACHHICRNLECETRRSLLFLPHLLWRT